MDGDVPNVGPPPEDLLTAVAVVVVDIQDRHVFARRPDDRLGGDGRIIEEAISAVERACRVMPGRTTQAVHRRRPIQHQIHRSQRDVDSGSRSDVRSSDEWSGGVQTPEPGPAAGMHRLARECRHRGIGHPLEHRPIRVGVSRQERALDGLCPEIGPGPFEESDHARVVDRGDRAFAVLRWRHDLEAPIRLERRSDLLRSFGHLIGRDRDAHVRLGRDVMTEVGS